MRIPKVGVHFNKQRRSWYIQYTLDGHRVRKTRPTEAEAQVLARRFQALLDEGRDPQREYEKQRRKEETRSTTLRAFFQTFMYRHGQHQSKSTQRLYRTVLDDLHKWEFNGRRLDEYALCDISLSVVEEYRTAKLEIDKVTPATVNRYTCNVLKSMLEKAFKWEYLDRNPIAGLEPLKEDNLRTVDLRPEDIGQLLDILPDSLANIVEWAVYTGMRKESILSLRVDQVERQEVPKERLRVRFIQKGDKEVVMQLHPLAEEVFRRARGDRNTGYLFLSPSGSRYHSIHKAYDRSVRKLGLLTVEGKKLCFHDLRRLHATWLTEDGYTQEEVSAALNQTSTRVTARYAQPRLTRELKLRKVR